MAQKYLLTVEDRFELSWGLTIAPGIALETPDVKMGSAIVLKRPGHPFLQTRIDSFSDPKPNFRRIKAIVLPQNIKATDVEIGMEIWLVGES